ncbi:MAG: chromate resistance protein ChrB domain-containing protein [Burkholderiales bacterium]
MNATNSNSLTDESVTDARRPAWLLFLLTVQGQQSALRMRVWRALKSLGTAVLRDGVYLLPNRPAFFESLRVLENEVAAADGGVQLLELDARDTQQQQEFEALFDRTADYDKLLGEIRDTRKKLSKIDASAVSTAAGRLRREVENLVALDFFPGRAASQTTLALEDFLADANAVLSPDEPHPVEGRVRKLDAAEYRGRTWATRKRPWADRLASAWLIRRFIDPGAHILWLDKPGDSPKDALGFDFDGATFTHIGGRVTFEVLAASFNLDNDPGVEKIGALIHYLDVGGVPVPEAAGFEAILRGARATFTDDDELLREVEKLFNLLYGTFVRQR